MLCVFVQTIYRVTKVEIIFIYVVLSPVLKQNRLVKSVEKSYMTILFVTSRLKGAIMVSKSKELIVPIWKKSTLTIEEAAAYSGIGRNKLRALTDNDDCLFWLACDCLF